MIDEDLILFWWGYNNGVLVELLMIFKTKEVKIFLKKAFLNVISGILLIITVIVCKDRLSLCFFFLCVRGFFTFTLDNFY